MNLEELFIQWGYTQQEFNHFIGDYSLARLKYETLYKNVVQMYQFLVSIGYTKEEVLKITKSFPSIFGFIIESIKQKIVFYDSINMHELAVINAKYLMQSISLSFARYMFLNTKGIDVTMSNYRILFAGSKRFEKQHNITKKQLLEMYNYENYVREKTNERVI